MEKTPVLRKKQPRLRLSKRNVSTSDSPHTPIKVKKQKYCNDTDFNEHNSSTDSGSVYKTPCRKTLNRYENDSVNIDINCSFSPSNHMFLSQEPTTQDVGWGKESKTPPPFLAIKSDEFATKLKNLHEQKRLEMQAKKENPKVATPKGFKKFLKDYEKHRECQLKSKNLNLISAELDSAFKENIRITKIDEKLCTSNNKNNNIKCNATLKSPNFKELNDDFDILSNFNILSNIDNILQKCTTKIVETARDENKIENNLYTNRVESKEEIVDLLDDSDSDVLLEASQQIESIVSKKESPPITSKEEIEKKSTNRKSLNLLFQDSFDEAFLTLENNDIDNGITKCTNSSNNTGVERSDNSSGRNIFSRYNSMPTESPTKPKTNQLKRHPSTSSLSSSSGVSTASSIDKNGIFERKMIAMKRLAKTKQRQQFNGGPGRNPNILFTNKQ